MSSSKHWLCKLSSRWHQPDPGKEALVDLAVRPEAEAFRVWLAHRALSLVGEQAQAWSSKHPEALKGSVEYANNAAVLEFIRSIIMVLDSES